MWVVFIRQAVQQFGGKEATVQVGKSIRQVCKARLLFKFSQGGKFISCRIGKYDSAVRKYFNWAVEC